MPEESRPKAGNDHTTAGMRMATMMMLCCLGVVVLFAILPLFPWPLAVVVGIAGVLGLLFAHVKLMGHGSHH